MKNTTLLALSAGTHAPQHTDLIVAQDIWEDIVEACVAREIEPKGAMTLTELLGFRVIVSENLKPDQWLLLPRDQKLLTPESLK